MKCSNILENSPVHWFSSWETHMESSFLSFNPCPASLRNLPYLCSIGPHFIQENISYWYKQMEKNYKIKKLQGSRHVWGLWTIPLLYWKCWNVRLKKKSWSLLPHFESFSTRISRLNVPRFGDEELGVYLPRIVSLHGLFGACLALSHQSNTILSINWIKIKNLRNWKDKMMFQKETDVHPFFPIAVNCKERIMREKLLFPHDLSNKNCSLLRFLYRFPLPKSEFYFYCGLL